MCTMPQHVYKVTPSTLSVYSERTEGKSSLPSFDNHKGNLQIKRRINAESLFHIIKGMHHPGQTYINVKYSIWRPSILKRDSLRKAITLTRPTIHAQLHPTLRSLLRRTPETPVKRRRLSGLSEHMFRWLKYFVRLPTDAKSKKRAGERICEVYANATSMFLVTFTNVPYTHANDTLTTRTYSDP